MGHTPYSVPSSLPHESIDEALGLEGCEVVGPLTQSDEFDGHAELLLHLHDDASLGRTVQLGQDDTGDVDGLTEDLRLTHAVLTRRRVEDEEHLIDGAALLDDALDLRQLVHEADLVVQAAGGVDEHDVALPLLAGLDGVERDGGRVGAGAQQAGEQLQHELGLTYLFITHDLAVVRVVADLVCVMERGKVVEQGSVDEIFANPAQEYTRRLLDAIPGASITLGGGAAGSL